MEADFEHCCICGEKVTNETADRSGINFTWHKLCLGKKPYNIHTDTQRLYHLMYKDVL